MIRRFSGFCSRSELGVGTILFHSALSAQPWWLDTYNVALSMRPERASKEVLTHLLMSRNVGSIQHLGRAKSLSQTSPPPCNPLCLTTMLCEESF